MCEPQPNRVIRNSPPSNITVETKVSSDMARNPSRLNPCSPGNGRGQDAIAPLPLPVAQVDVPFIGHPPTPMIGPPSSSSAVVFWESVRTA
jgi:hypothetical protein